MIDYFMLLIPKTANNHVRFHIHKQEIFILFTDGSNWFHACVCVSVSLPVLIAHLSELGQNKYLVADIWIVRLRGSFSLTVKLNCSFLRVEGLRKGHLIWKAMANDNQYCIIWYSNDNQILTMDLFWMSLIFKMLALVLLRCTESSDAKFGKYHLLIVF